MQPPRSLRCAGVLGSRMVVDTCSNRCVLIFEKKVAGQRPHLPGQRHDSCRSCHSGQVLDPCVPCVLSAAGLCSAVWDKGCLERQRERPAAQGAAARLGPQHVPAAPAMSSASSPVKALQEPMVLLGSCAAALRTSRGPCQCPVACPWQLMAVSCVVAWLPAFGPQPSSMPWVSRDGSAPCDAAQGRSSMVCLW
jgi:hypothetical protein